MRVEVAVERARRAAARCRGEACRSARRSLGRSRAASPGWRSAQASVSAKDGTSATGATSCSISATPTGSPCAHVAIFAISFARPWRSSSPTYSIRSAQASVSALTPACRKRSATQATRPRLGDVVEQQVAGLRTRLGERARPSSPRARRGRARCPARARRGRWRSPRRRRPSSRLSAAGSVLLLAPVDVVTSDEPCVAEQAARVAERDDVGPARLERRDDLDRLGHEPRTEALDRGLDLRPVAARDQVRPASGRAARSSAYRTRRSVRTVNVRPSDSSTMRPLSSVR